MTLPHVADAGSMEVYARRRARVLAALGDDAALILPASPEILLGRDVELRYLPDAELYYLTGYTEPEAVAVLCPSCAEAPFTLFVRPRDPEKEVWTGARGGPEAARERFGANAAHPIAELADRLPRITARADTLYFRLDAGRPDIEAAVRQVLGAGRKGRQRTGRGPRGLVDPGALLDDMRLRKDAEELRISREAARITAEAFREAAGLVRPGRGEWELEAALEAAFRRRGADGPAFPTIVAGGANATVLHYVANARPLGGGELVLIDAGARYGMYTGDVSRTFPVSGTFSAAQRSLYDAVRAAQAAALGAVRPGSTVEATHEAATRVLLGALIEHGLLDGELDGWVELARRDEVGLTAEERDRRKRYRRFLPHKTSHWLGLDVHDVADYAVRGEPRPLEPGMLLTVEPGLYLPVAADVPEALRGIGIRIEDDVVVTETGAEVLTASLPAGAADVEELVRG